MGSIRRPCPTNGAKIISTYMKHTVGLRADGTAVAKGSNEHGQCDVAAWTDIVAVATGSSHTVGLHGNGTVAATGSNRHGQCNVTTWTDIVDVAAAGSHTVGLRSDGTVVATGQREHGRCDVYRWAGIVAVAAGGSHTVGLLANGEAVACGWNDHGQCNVGNWRDITMVSAGGRHTVGLRSDGTLVATGENANGECDVSDLTHVIAVCASGSLTVALLSNGRVTYRGKMAQAPSGRLDVRSWTDVVAISAGIQNIVAVRADGTALATGNNAYCQCDLGGWVLGAIAPVMPKTGVGAIPTAVPEKEHSVVVDALRSVGAKESFQLAVEEALRVLGTDALEKPMSFVGAVADLYDTNAPEVTVLFAHCSEELLQPYADAVSEGTRSALEQAAKRVELWLHEVRRVDAGDSQKIAWAIARALGEVGSNDAGDGPSVRQPHKDEMTAVSLMGDPAIVCPRCGATMSSAYMFCAWCGERLQPTSPQKSYEVTFSSSAGDSWRVFRYDKLTGNDKATNSAASSRDSSQVSPGESGDNSSTPPYPRVAGVNPQPTVARYSWVQLKSLSRAIAAVGSDEEGFAIARGYNLTDADGKLRGDTKAVTLRDGTQARVRILGFRQDELTSGRRSGISFEFADVPAKLRMNDTRTNDGGWEASGMRSWLNSSFLALLPNDLRGGVETARKRTNNVGKVDRSDVASMVTLTADRLWLLSVAEVYGEFQGGWYVSPIYKAEGNQYQLYADHGVDVDSHGFCAKNGVDQRWLLRSPYALYANRFPYVCPDGGWGINLFPTDEAGVSPGFCF